MKYLGKIQDPKDLVTKEYVDNGHILQTKTYTNVYGTAASWAGSSFAYGKVTPENFFKPWHIKLKMTVEASGSNYAHASSVFVLDGIQDTYMSYSCQNAIQHTSYRPMYYHMYYRFKQAAIEGGGCHYLGFSMLYSWSYTTSANPRTVTIDILESENCSFEFVNSLIAYNTVIGYSNFNALSNFNFSSNGLIETGDDNDANYYNRDYYSSRVAAQAVYRYQFVLSKMDGSLIPFSTTDNNTGTSKTMNTTPFDPLGRIYWYYSSGTTAAGANFGNNVLYSQFLSDWTYSFNIAKGGFTARQPVYIVASPQSDGSAVLASPYVTQSLPSSADGKLYIYLGQTYEDSSTYRIYHSWYHPVFEYRDGGIKRYERNADRVNGHTVAADVPSGAKFTDTVTTATTTGTGNAVTAITASNGALTVTKGSTFNNYTHPSYTARTSSLYKITVDNTGHVSDVASVQKSDITDLGIPGAATDVKIDNTSIVSNGIAGITQAKLGSGYATCTTEEATTAKVATLTNYKPITGGYVSVCFTKGFHKRANTTLNINAQGAYGVSFNSSYLDAGIVARSGEIVTFLFDGSYYRVLSVDTRMPRYGSEIDYDQDYTVTEAIDFKQAKLVSGTNIKTINNESLLGSGNISISGGGNFSGTTFYSGNSSTAEHNANSAVKNGNYYYSSNGPAMTLGATTNDGALYVQSYSDSWVGQIAQDYRNGGLFVRGKNNGSWQSWQQVYDTGHTIKTNSTNLPQFSGAPSYLVGIDAFADGGTMKWQSASSVSVGYATSAGSATDSSKLPLTGGTISGNLSVTGTLTTPAFSTDSNNYVKTVSWLQVNGSSDNAAWTDVWVNQNNWLYKRAKSSFISDVKGGFTDYVTDQGTSGSWRYRKWNSGKIEAWYESTVSSGTTHTQIGSVYRGTWSLSIPTAIGFSSVPKLIIGNNNDATHVISINGKASSTTQISGYYFRPNSNSSSITLYPSIYAWTN